MENEKEKKTKWHDWHSAFLYFLFFIEHPGYRRDCLPYWNMANVDVPIERQWKHKRLYPLNVVKAILYHIPNRVSKIGKISLVLPSLGSFVLVDLREDAFYTCKTHGIPTCWLVLPLPIVFGDFHVIYVFFSTPKVGTPWNIANQLSPGAYFIPHIWYMAKDGIRNFGMI